MTRLELPVSAKKSQKQCAAVFHVFSLTRDLVKLEGLSPPRRKPRRIVIQDAYQVDLRPGACAFLLHPVVHRLG